MSPVARPARLRTSTRLHFVLLRFGMISLTSSILDNIFFYLVFHASGSIALAQLIARTISLLFNYYFVRRSVFFSPGGHHVLFPRYLLLTTLNALASYIGIRLLSSVTPLGVVPSKIVAETLLFGLNFTLQRAYIFRHRAPEDRLSGPRTAEL